MSTELKKKQQHCPIFNIPCSCSIQLKVVQIELIPEVMV